MYSDYADKILGHSGPKKALIRCIIEIEMRIEMAAFLTNKLGPQYHTGLKYCFTGHTSAKF